MKKIILTLPALAISLASAWAAEEFTQDVSKLPEGARTFISKNFSDAKIAGIKIEKEFTFVEDYEVLLSDGTKIEFLPDGQMKEIENKAAGIASSAIPKAISDYVSNNYANQKIVKIESKNYGYEVKISSGIELMFDKNGKFLSLDM